MKKYKLATCLLLPLTAYADMNADVRGFHIINTPMSKSVQKTNEVNETKETDNYILFLSELKKNAPSEIKAYQKSDDTDTHLKKMVNEIKLSVPFKKPQVIAEENIIGFAAIGSYDNGWSGIKMFFHDYYLGTCAYSFEKYLAIEAQANYVKNLINNQPTFTSIEGNKNGGYLYTVSWNKDNKTSVYDYKIECDHKTIDYEFLNKIILLANRIDKN